MCSLILVLSLKKKIAYRRREGYEFMIGPPKVINKTVNGKLLEPYEVFPSLNDKTEFLYIFDLIGMFPCVATGAGFF